MRYALADQLGVDAFHISKHDQLLQACFIPDIALGVRMRLPPFFCRNSKQRDVQHIRFVGVCITLPLRRHVRRDQHIFDRVGVYPVIDLCQRPVEVPAQRESAVLIIFQPLIILDDIQLEFS